jgi:ribose 5-phosphate isomerase
VNVLGKFPLPVEVIPMARSFVARQILQASPGASRSGATARSPTTAT